MMTAKQLTDKRLADLLDETVIGSQALDTAFGSIAVSGLQLDSRNVVAGDLFLACAGSLVDGRDYIEAAVNAGAVAVLAERDDRWQRSNIFQGVPVVVVEALPKKLSHIAGRFYDHPSTKIPLVGVTGTNGKTSCTQLLMQLLNQAGKTCGVIGTLGVGVDGALEAGVNTTPDAVAIQKQIFEWQQAGVDLVAMEVSSHGLEQGRVAALNYEQAIFTNLTRDHLDYHGTMQAYGDAKTRLFQMPGLRVATLNGDDAFVASLTKQIPAGVKQYIFSINGRSCSGLDANVWVEDVCYHENGVSAQLHSPWGQYPLNSPLLGAFNLSNLLASIIAAVNFGLPIERMLAAAATLQTVAGRMERLPSSTGITAVVDYAHTPDALEKALVAMRQHTKGKLWCVFGCGGDRDQGKRAQMGGIAQRYADHIVVTSDNPRSEDPAAIINEILGGVDRPSLVEEDRSKAIEFAIAQAGAGDSVLVAGKGHEDYQQIGNQRIPYSDIKQVRLALAAREQLSGGGQ